MEQIINRACQRLYEAGFRKAYKEPNGSQVEEAVQNAIREYNQLVDEEHIWEAVWYATHYDS